VGARGGRGARGAGTEAQGAHNRAGLLRGAWGVWSHAGCMVVHGVDDRIGAIERSR
jgi:hypothetical protein